MRRALTGSSLVVAGTLLVGAMAVPPSQAASASVSTVRVSDASPLPDECPGTRNHESEPVVAVDPRDPRHLVAAWAQDEESGMVTAVSGNGGATWSAASPVPGLTACTGGALPYVAHPHVEFGLDPGTVYLAAMASDRNTSVQTLVSRSTDGGATWTLTTRPDPVAGDLLNDFDSFSVEPDTGALLVVWNPAEPVLVREPTNLSRSIDGGRTWTVSQIRTAAPGTSSWSDLLALPDGRLLLTYIESPLSEFLLGTGAPVEVQAVVSQDKGQTWSTPRRLGAGAALQWPRGAVGSDGAVHVAWVQSSAGGTCTRFGDLPFTRFWSRNGGGGNCEIALASSGDGVEWSPTRSLAGWGGEWMPSPGIAANRDGTVTVVHAQPKPDGTTGRVLLSTGHPAGEWETVLAGSVDLAALLGGGLYQGAAAGRCGPVAAALLSDPNDTALDSTGVFMLQPHGRGCQP